MIETFNDLYDATLFIETLAEEARRDNAFFKVELFLLPDGRWRCGVLKEEQLELPLE